LPICKTAKTSVPKEIRWPRRKGRADLVALGH
jgi:hypothetical protein